MRAGHMVSVNFLASQRRYFILCGKEVKRPYPGSLRTTVCAPDKITALSGNVRYPSGLAGIWPHQTLGDPVGNNRYGGKGMDREQQAVVEARIGGDNGFGWGLTRGRGRWAEESNPRDHHDETHTH